MNPLAREIQAQLQTMMTSEADAEATAIRKKVLMDLAELRQSWMNVLNAYRAYMAFRGKTSLQNLRLYSDGFKEQLEKFGALSDDMTFEQVDAYDRIQNISKKYFTALEEVIKVHSSEKWRTDSYLIRTEIGPLVDGIKDNIDSLVSSQRKLSQQISQGLVQSVSEAKGLVFTLLIVSIIVALVGGVLMVLMIVKPLNQAVEAMTDIAKGEGDLTRRLEVVGKDEIAKLGQAFNHFIERVHSIVSQVAGSTSQLAAASEEMSVIVDQTKKGIQRQKTETEQVATAMNEMTSTVQEVSNNADQAASAANEADTEAMNGRDVVNRTVQSIQNLAEEVQKASDVIHGLEKESENIGTVLDVIQGIAEQTNLLALNAAIEAARAGEQGRGFAVVADEVRNLASRTQQSTQEIQSMIERLQVGAQNAVGVMQGGTEQAQASVQQAGDAGSALEAIASAVNNISNMNTQIASAANQQGQVANEINQNIVNITQVADQSAEGTSELAKSSVALAELASDLQTMVAQFKI
jgi:methyl-accepting chemotaxis protein